MTTANPGDTVKFHYTGRLSDGQEFDSSHGEAPFEVTLGFGTIIPGLEAALVGMEPGQKRTVTLQPQDAYGERDDRLIQKIEKERIPNNEKLAVGTVLEAQLPQSPQPVRLRVTEIDQATVTLDANHPLAGRELTFDVEMVAVSEGAKS